MFNSLRPRTFNPAQKYGLNSWSLKARAWRVSLMQNCVGVLFKVSLCTEGNRLDIYTVVIEWLPTYLGSAKTA